MKKVLFTLVILVILAAVGFGFGYVPLRLEPATRAVLFSKTSGWDDQVYEAGSFAWAWQLLIPTNATLYVYDTSARSVSLSARSLLPSAEVYAAALDGQTRFEHRLSLDLQYRLAPAGIRALAPVGVHGDSLEDWYGDTDAAIEQLVLSVAAQIVREAAGDAAAGDAAAANATDNEEIGAALDPGAMADEISARVGERMPQIEVIGVTVREAALPDIRLYRAARNLYEDVLDARRDALIEAARSIADEQATADARMDNLQRYGQILTEYPVLLEYLEIAAQNDSDPLNLTDLRDAAVQTQ